MTDSPHAPAMARKDALILRWVTEAPEDFKRRVMGRLEFADNGCWLWTGSPGSRYGNVCIPASVGQTPQVAGGVKVKVHRAVWISLRSEIPWGMVLDHDSEHGCHNTRCANPDHLSIATTKQNVHTGRGPAALNARKTHCKSGHPMDDPSNLGKRECLTCKKLRRDRDLAIVRQARAITGLTWSQYEHIYGRSASTALRIIKTGVPA